MFARFALRDAVILALAMGVWWLAAAASSGTGALGDFTGFVAGAMLTVTAFVLHEWGHVAGAFASGSRLTASPSVATPFIFAYDAKRNTLRQFLVMSFGGFLVTGTLIWAVYTQLPDGLLASRVARGGVLFLAFLGVTLELPLVLVALYKRAIPEAVAVQPRRPRAASASPVAPAA